MPRLRLGVALMLEGQVAHEVDGLRRGLGDGAFGRIAPHVTLVPPVNVNVGRLPEVLDVLRGAAASMPSQFTFQVGPVSTFAPKTPVVMLDVHDDASGSVERLRQLVFVEPLARTLTWPFVPHVTLANEATEEQLLLAPKILSGYRADVPVDRVCLLQQGGGRTWHVIADVELGPPAIVGRGGLELELTGSRSFDPVVREALGLPSPLEPEEAEVVEADPLLPPPRGMVVTARRDGEVLGVAVGRHVGRDVDLLQHVVAEEVRGQGIGSHLLQALFGRARAAGATRVVAPECLCTCSFLARHGFRDGVRLL